MRLILIFLCRRFVHGMGRTHHIQDARRRAQPEKHEQKQRQSAQPIIKEPADDSANDKPRNQFGREAKSKSELGAPALRLSRLGLCATQTGQFPAQFVEPAIRPGSPPSSWSLAHSVPSWPTATFAPQYRAEPGAP